LFAVGRTATTDLLNLHKVGVTVHKNKKIETLSNEIDKTKADNIYALGDVV
jgi:pyruvate/2-oxoglutarate dehydrogenase complex dihydrolipoamide dehydrogenase (E3) component